MIFDYKYKIHLIHIVGNSISIIKTMNIKAVTKLFRANNGTFAVRTDFPTYTKGRTHHFFLNEKTGEQLTYHVLTKAIPPKDLEKLVSSNVFGKVIDTLNKESNEIPYGIIIIVAILGGTIGFLINEFM